MQKIFFVLALLMFGSVGLVASDHSESIRSDSQLEEFSISNEYSTEQGGVSFDDDCEYAHKYCIKRNYCRCMKANGCGWMVAKQCGFK